MDDDGDVMCVSDDVIVVCEGCCGGCGGCVLGEGCGVDVGIVMGGVVCGEGGVMVDVYGDCD